MKNMYQSDVENSNLLLAGGRSAYDGLGVDMGNSATVVTTGGDMLIPPYMLPDASHGVNDNSTLLHSQPDLMRQWTPLDSGPPARISTATAMYSDPDTTTMPYMSSSRAAHATSTPVDYGPGAFSALGLLSSSLPDTVGSRGHLMDTKPVLPLPIRTQPADANTRSATNTSLSSDMTSSQASSSSFKQYWVSDASALSGPRGSSSQQSTSASILRIHSPVNLYNPTSSSGYPNSSVMPLPSNSSNMHSPSSSGDQQRNSARLTADSTTISKIRTSSTGTTSYPQRTVGLSKVY